MKHKLCIIALILIAHTNIIQTNQSYHKKSFHLQDKIAARQRAINDMRIRQHFLYQSDKHTIKWAPFKLIGISITVIQRAQLFQECFQKKDTPSASFVITSAMMGAAAICYAKWAITDAAHAIANIYCNDPLDTYIQIEQAEIDRLLKELAHPTEPRE